jgi:hypothetical protein
LYQNVSFLPSFGTHIFFIKLENILSLVFYTRDTQTNIREEREIYENVFGDNEFFAPAKKKAKDEELTEGVAKLKVSD